MQNSDAQKIIEEFLTFLNIAVERIDITDDGAHSVFLIRTQDSGLLIGSSGENLKAFNALVRRVLEKRYGVENVKPFIVDVNGYYGKRVREIKQQAKLLAERTRLFKSDVEMNPMNAYERRVVHDLFTGDPDVYTESRGEGKLRHIVLRYKVPESALFPTDSTLLKG